MTRKTNFRDTLAHKRRELHDLANFIGTRAGDTPNYSLLLGAGASVTSGVRSANALVEEWRKDLYEKLAPSAAQAYDRVSAIEYFSRECSQWYNASREYSSLFEKKFDLPRQRRMFVESEVANRLPSIGYAYLMHLVKRRYFNTIFTTNFDDLLNEAFHHFSDERPIVCAHDSSIASVTVTSARPKIIKLHGDYLFDDIKSTQRETESLEQNTKKKFVEFCKDFGLVVTGYSGCDRSIMDVLNGLLRSEEFLKNGVYWCVRSGDSEICEELERFLWRDRVYWVEVDGFDELMAELYGAFVGSSLPVDTIMVSEKPRRIIETFCSSQLLSASPSGVVQGHLARFRRELQKEQVVDAFRGLKDADDERERSEDSLRDDQTAKLLRIKRLMSLRELRSAQSLLAQELQTSERDAFFVELSKLKFEVDKELGELASARAVIDRLKEYDPNNVVYLNMESQVETRFENKARVLRLSLERDQYNTFAFNHLAEALLDQSEHVVGGKRREMIDEAIGLFRQSMEKDPSIRNPAWLKLGRYLLSTTELSKDDRDTEVEKIVERYQKIDARDRDLLRFRIERVSVSKSARTSKDAQDLLDELVRYQKEAPRHLGKRFELLRLRALAAFFRRNEFDTLVATLELDERYSRYSEFHALVSRGYAGFGDYDAALVSALKAFELRPSSELALQVAATAELLENEEVFITHGEKLLLQLSAEDQQRYRLHEARARRDYASAVRLIRARGQDRDRSTYIVDETHELLWAGEFSDAERIARVALDEASFSPMLGPLIINYELARKAGGQAPNRGRLGTLAKTTNDPQVRASAYYLLDDDAKAREHFTELLSSRPGRFRSISKWFIFKDGDGAAFLQSLKAGLPLAA